MHLHTGSYPDLCLLICERRTGDAGDRFPGFSVRNLVETGSGSIWDLPHDYRKYLCHGGGAIIIGVPIGLLCAIFMARFCPPKLHRILKPAIDLLAGIPSIVYGFFGLVVIVPWIQELTDTSGKNVLTASIMLGIMILPTIIVYTVMQGRVLSTMAHSVIKA